MNLEEREWELQAVSPLDGRYQKQCSCLSKYFSESGLIQYRLFIEYRYIHALVTFLSANNKPTPAIHFKKQPPFDLSDMVNVKILEEKVNHDIKACELFLQQQCNVEAHPFIHFGLTSQDINNTAIPLSLLDFLRNMYLHQLDGVIEILKTLAEGWLDTLMLGRTHGQPATPTTLGKEFLVFVERLALQRCELESMPLTAKFGGATGGLNAHHLAYPDLNWNKFCTDFVHSLGLQREHFTTQISHYDGLARIFHCLIRTNTILLDLVRDVWAYISLEYFKQNINPSEVGSSTMPHKVNPIDFENAEGNLGLASAIWEHLATKLPISRFQRDLSDSTVLRNLGVPAGHTLIAFSALKRGLRKLRLNPSALNRDLEENFAIVTEGIQTIMRREGIPNAYDVIKNISRTGEKMDPNALASFIEKLDVSETIKNELKNLSVFSYKPHSFKGESFSRFSNTPHHGVTISIDDTNHITLCYFGSGV